MKSGPLRALLALTFFVLVGSSFAKAQPSPAPVNVILWFDTEDYLLPADDDAAKRIAEMLTQRGIQATFKVVGEKARVLEKRGRTDVIAALKMHTIGYHSNFHSVHPVPAEYLADCGLLDGIEEFVRHESRGAADVRRIFGVPTLACYGQPGSSWAPQAIAALGQCGIGNDGVPCYLDSGTHIGIHGSPYWYCGALVVYDMTPNETRMNLWEEGALPLAQKTVTEMADRLAHNGGGLISIYYHPCEWVHKEFWDSVNFWRGNNPPREQWKPPTQRSPEETNGAFERWGQYIDTIRSLPGVHFVTAAQLPRLYPDLLRTEGASSEDVLELARRLAALESRGIDFQIVNGKAFSPADQFALLTAAVADCFHSEGKPTFPLKVPSALLGPDGPPPANVSQREPLGWLTFRDTVREAADYVQFHHRIPARVFIGPDPVPPADFLVTTANAYLAIRVNQPPASIGMAHNIDLLTAHHVTDDKPSVYGGWIIHRANYRAPKILDVARLQAWTLKPALRAGAS